MATATKKATPNKSKGVAGKFVFVWEEDPGLSSQPTGGNAIQRPVPPLNPAHYALSINGPAVPPNIYQQGTPEFRYWAAAEAAERAVAFWTPLVPPGTTWNAAVGPKLTILLDEGSDFNAYYDRAALNFFHGMAQGRSVYSGESPDVVCHETGHAILDSIRPQLWDAMFVEVAAFHESFADCSAILSSLQLPSLRQEVLFETGGVLYRNSRLSRLAEQLGWAIRQTRPDAVEPDCLRNAVNSLFYADPNTLPTNAPASSLSSEPHSFSRVFTAAFFEALSGMFAAQGTQDEAALSSASTEAGRLLITAVLNAPVVPNYYSQVAAHMVDAAANANDKAAIKSAFVRHGVLSLASATAIGRASGSGAGMVAGASMVATLASRAVALPLASLSMPELGLKATEIFVHATSEARRFEVAGAAPSSGSVSPPAHEVAAKSYLVDLFRRGSVDIGEHGDPDVSVYHPTARRTYHLVRQDEGIVVKRLRVDCGFGCPGCG